MKRVIVVLILSITVSTLWAQSRADSAAMYLEKSQKQNKTAWILLGAGTGSALLGYAMAQTSDLDEGGFAFGGLMMLAGIGMDVTSLVFFGMSETNAEKAARLMLQVDNPPVVLKNGGTPACPTLRLTIRINHTR